ncbi:dCTP deaminase [Magnetococcales bacterium HHB-1]
MRLSDTDILRYLSEKQIEIDPPPPEECIGSFSIDVHLAHVFREFHHSGMPFLDLADPKGTASMIERSMKEVTIEEGGRYYLHPGKFALGMTVERIRLPDNVVGWLDGRSSLARMGLMVHITAHAIDPGWNGNITFEFFNAGPLPLALPPGLRIGAISFETLSTPTSRPYGKKQGAKYHNQDAPIPSRILFEKRGG